MNKIRKLTEKEGIEWDSIKEMQRDNDINKILTNCFEPESVRQDDKEHIFDWACDVVNDKEKLIFLMERRKFEELSRI